jgi:tetratricopeptide (TPR) repeat protein
MKRPGKRTLVLCAALAAAAVVFGLLAWQDRADPGDALADAASAETARPAAITIDYPAGESVFPPEITPPTFLWHDAGKTAVRWRIDVTFADGSPAVQAESPGEPPRIGEIDARCVAKTNQPPRFTPYEAAARTWTPDAETWAAIKRHSAAGAATVTIAGIGGKEGNGPVSCGSVTIRTSKDPVGAPIFYRDVPLMPTASEKGVIQPLAKGALPLIAWRLRDIGQPHSRLLMTDLHTCANCHSFSGDGKTLGIDVDGPANDKGTYAIASVQQQMSIRPENIITWNSFPGKPPGHKTIGFMAQLSPDGRYAAVTLNEELYVANFTDYTFLQVFYPTRGIIGYYDRTTGAMKALPGADDPHYVQTGAVWSPDGKYLVFARAEAKESYPKGRKLAQYAGDPNEVQIQYDLCRIPFNEGQGGRAEPIAGASQNGMSNNFPKISPDGRWIVFVQCRNGQLMRPDGKLHILPAEGGAARPLGCNLRQMNSWHSFSPNGRWLVFSSKSRSPYTQMFLTHLDEEGRDSPAILIENATAANRAVNIPEFVNMAPDGLSWLKIDVPAAEVYRLCDLGLKQMKQGQQEQAIAYFREALALDAEYVPALNILGLALANCGRMDEAITHFQTALKIKPDSVTVHTNLGLVLAKCGQISDAIAHYQQALAIDPDCGPVHNNLGALLADRGQFDEAIEHYQKAREIRPDYADIRRNIELAQSQRQSILRALVEGRELLRSRPRDTALLNDTAWLLATNPNASVRKGPEAVELAQRAAELSGGKAPEILGTLAAAYAEVGRFAEAVQTARRALDLATQQNKPALAESIEAKIRLYTAETPFRDLPPPPAKTSVQP